MKHRAVVAAILLSSSAAFATDCPRHPTPAFQALPPGERNLLVYDAFWESLEKNHYDPQMLSRAEVRALRERGRSQAAVAGYPASLYGQVFSDITRQLSDARLKVELPPAADSATSRRRYSKSPEEAQRLAESLFGDAGFDQATLRRGSKNIRVVTEVRPDSPAEQAGIRPGWHVVSFNANKDAKRDALQFSGEFLPLDPLDALAWERGELPMDPPDSRRVLRIQYAQRPQQARQPIEHRSVVDDVRYLRFDKFGDDAFMTPVYQALREAGPDGLIIDLRWNGGGELRQAQKLAGVLLGDVVLGIQQDARGLETIRALRPLRPLRQYQGPLAVLIGPGSSSASEILAAAIKDHRRGKLVGRMTNGSLASSDVFPLPDGGLVTLPTRDFRSASNRRLEGVGVTPDVRVLPTLQDVRAGRDATLERAVQLIRASAGGRPTPDFRHRRDELYPPI